MALDTKQKRGAAMLLGQPYRPWLAEPDGTLSATDRLSLLKLGSSIVVVLPTGIVTIAWSARKPSITWTGRP